jgi:hypothetical protein
LLQWCGRPCPAPSVRGPWLGDCLGSRSRRGCRHRCLGNVAPGCRLSTLVLYRGKAGGRLSRLGWRPRRLGCPVSLNRVVFSANRVVRTSVSANLVTRLRALGVLDGCTGWGGSGRAMHRVVVRRRGTRGQRTGTKPGLAQRAPLAVVLGLRPVSRPVFGGGSGAVDRAPHLHNSSARWRMLREPLRSA